MGSLTSKRLNYIKIGACTKEYCLNWYTDAMVMKYIKGRPLTTAEAESRFNEIVLINKANSTTGFYAVQLKESGNYIGIAKLIYLNDQEVEVGYGLTPQFWRQGLGSEMLGALIETTNQLEKLNNLVGIVSPQNEVSIHILKKYGFQFHSKGKESKTSLYFKLSITP